MTHCRWKLLIRFALLPVAAACLSAAAGAAMPSGDTNADHPSSDVSATARSQARQDVRVSDLIHKSVQSPEGKKLGRIEDLVIDVRTGDVRYAMLSFDPDALESEKLFAVPTKKLRSSADGRVLVYDMTRDKLARADTALEDRKRVDGLDLVDGIVQPSSNDARAFRASALLGRPVNDSRLEAIGQLKDLVVDMSAQKVHYAVLAFDPAWAAPHELRALPMSALGLARDRRTLVLQASPERVRALKGFDAETLRASLNDPAWVAGIDRTLATLSPTAAAAQVGAATPAGLFARLDRNGDGFIDRSEAAANTGVDSAWLRLDADRDGRISRDEFTTNYHMQARS